MKTTRITIRQLQVFVALAKTGNFHKCAASAGLSQSALSASLKQLERAVGFALIDRTTRQVSMSRLGEELLPAIEQILGDVEALTERAAAAAAGRAGPIRIVGLHSLTTRLLPPVMAAFARANPGIHFSVTENTTSEIIRDVSRGAADVGFTSFRANATDLGFEPLLSDAYMLVAPLGHPLAQKRIVSWDDLSPYPFLAMTRGTQTRDLMDEILQSAGRAVTPAHEAFHFGSIEQFILQDMGVTAIPALVLSQEHRERLTIRPLVGPEIFRHLGIVSHKRRKISPALANFLEELRIAVGRLRQPGLKSLLPPPREGTR
ncbi:MAG: LysR family transcriptional regulator [Dongiaceae bacterium]